MTKEELILDEIHRLRDDVACMRGELVKVSVEVARLQVKSGTWGFLAGLLPAVGAAIYIMIK